MCLKYRGSQTTLPLIIQIPFPNIMKGYKMFIIYKIDNDMLGLLLHVFLLYMIIRTMCKQRKSMLYVMYVIKQVTLR